MRLSFTTVLLLGVNLLILAAGWSTHTWIGSQIHDLFTRHETSLNQQKAEFIAKSIRQNVHMGDYVGVRTVFQNALNDSDVKMIRVIPENGTEGTCVDKDGSCYSKAGTPSETLKSHLYYDPEGKQLLGTVLIRFENNNTARLNETISIYLALALGLLAVFANLAMFICLRSLKKQIDWSIDAVRNLANGETVAVKKSALIEKTKFSGALDQLKDVMQNYKTKVERASKREVFTEIALKLAHDIRDPLVALDATVDSLPHIPEEKRIIIRNARTRIRNIANGFIERSKSAFLDDDTHNKASLEQSTIAQSFQDEASTDLLSGLIELIVSEKQEQYRNLTGVHIDANLGAATYGLFSKVQADTFKRALSNVITNAVESIEHRGSVTISLHRDGEQNVIRIADNGRGIPPDVLRQLPSKGKSFGKKHGSGFGLYHAKQAVESWNGSLQIESKVGQGTIVTISLPVASPPNWFVPELRLTPGTSVCALDDEGSIHNIWKDRIAASGASSKTIDLRCFSRTSEIIDWHVQNQDKADKTVFLVDYELAGEPMNGLKVIELLQIQKQANLVTCRYEDASVQEECERLGVRHIPKHLARFVPLEIEEGVPA